ncbi:MAG: hypothetical protein ACOC31_05955 [Bacteroidota bacterium]
MKNKIIYSLDIDDIQRVAEQEIDRRLKPEEIDALEEGIAKNLNWYEAIAIAIMEKIPND